MDNIDKTSPFHVILTPTVTVAKVMSSFTTVANSRIRTNNSKHFHQGHNPLSKSRSLNLILNSVLTHHVTFKMWTLEKLCCAFSKLYSNLNVFLMLFFSMHVLKARASAFYLLGPSAWLFFKDYAIKLKSIAYNLYSINGLCTIGTFLSFCKFELLILSTSIMTIKRLTLEPATDFGTTNDEVSYNLKFTYKFSLHFRKLAHNLTFTLFFRNIWSKSSLYLNLRAMH